MPRAFCRHLRWQWLSRAGLGLAVACGLTLHPSLIYAAHATFASQVTPIPDEIWQDIVGSTWKPGCPVGQQGLAYIALSYWGFDEQPHQGVLIVARDRAGDIVDIFSQLFHEHFPVQAMTLIDHYHGKEREAIAAINTIAFNCRPQIGSHNHSSHSYGVAIDINPGLNPYVNRRTLIPEQAAAYVARDPRRAGVITAHSSIHKAFVSRGWRWGGDWYRLKDYMHFEKK